MLSLDCPWLKTLKRLTAAFWRRLELTLNYWLWRCGGSVSEISWFTILGYFCWQWSNYINQLWIVEGFLDFRFCSIFPSVVLLLVLSAFSALDASFNLTWHWTTTDCIILYVSLWCPANIWMFRNRIFAFLNTVF